MVTALALRFKTTCDGDVVGFSEGIFIILYLRRH